VETLDTSTFTSISQYPNLTDDLAKYSRDDQERIELSRLLCRTDLFFLLWYVCNRQDCYRQWVLERCQDVRRSPNGNLDLWAREHYKSTIVTFGQTIQDVLSSHGKEPLKKWNGREVTVGIFSHVRPIAKGFLRQIKSEFEQNQMLKSLFPDILFDNPQKEAPKWSEDDGLVLKRKSNPKESTIEAHGIIDGMPTGKHFLVMNYDDVVTEKSVTTPDMIKKTITQLELSYNLGTDGGYKRFVGSKYHLFDAYRTIAERGTAKLRLFPATDNGKADGKPVLISQESLDEKRRDMGPYTFGCQMLLNPKADEVQSFDAKWIRYHNAEEPIENIGNRYLIVDPANEKKKRSDYTAAVVIELREDENYYELESIRDRLSLTERADMVFRLHRKWGKPIVAYEEYGMQADIQHIEDRQAREKYHFDIIPLGGSMAKFDRIRKMIPIFEQGRYFLPYTCPQKDYEGQPYDATAVFLRDEYYPFPVLSHDDMFDVKARILDEKLAVEFPETERYPMPQQAVGMSF